MQSIGITNVLWSFVTSSPRTEITPLKVFEFAGAFEQAVMILLVLGMVAAVAVLIAKLSKSGRLPGGSAFLSALRLGGPILGGLGASWSLLNMTLGYANVGADLPLSVLAPGFAAAFLQIALGLKLGAIAGAAHWAVESRIDRQVLGA